MLLGGSYGLLGYGIDFSLVLVLACQVFAKAMKS